MAVTGCNDEKGTTDPAEKNYTVGICQFVQHPALDTATAGFKRALTEKLGDKVTFKEENASADSTTCTTIINQFVSSNVDLIMANATPAVQTAVSGTPDIPILGTSVTEYGIAHLRGQSLASRAKQLIAIAHPNFRDELTFAARKRGILV